MNRIYIPENYKPVLDAYDTQRAIAYIKETFQQEFSKALNLKRVSAPLFVHRMLRPERQPERLWSGLWPLTFPPWAWTRRWCIRWQNGSAWPSSATTFTVGKGLYTDMNAIRRDEALDNIHSIYVDQWDWEKIITRENRNLDFLKRIVRAIVGAICDTTRPPARAASPSCAPQLSREVTFITAAGAGGYVSRSGHRHGAGKRLCAGAQDCLHHADRRTCSAPASPTTAAPPTMTTGI